MTPSASNAASSPQQSVASAPVEAVRRAVAGVIHGKDEVIDLALIALISGGHLLVEDIPGVGKSTLARTMSRSIGGQFNRIQFTSDLLPADVLGVNVWRTQTGQFEFHPGPLFANFVLADEINRAPPRTQSALLEAMGEHQITVDGTSHPLPSPFMVIATQNPLEHYGTYPLPESQRDRFVLRVSIGYAAAEVEAELLREDTPGSTVSVDPVTTPAAIEAVQAEVTRTFLHPDLAGYAQRIVGATRDHSGLRLGVSTRGALAWVRAAKARARLEHRDQVTIDDLQELAVPALAHRLMPAHGDQNEDTAGTDEIIRDIVATVPVPR